MNRIRYFCTVSIQTSLYGTPSLNRTLPVLFFEQARLMTVSPPTTPRGRRDTSEMHSHAPTCSELDSFIQFAAQFLLVSFGLLFSFHFATFTLFFVAKLVYCRQIFLFGLCIFNIFLNIATNEINLNETLNFFRHCVLCSN